MIYIIGLIIIIIISIILSLNGKYHIKKNFPNGIENEEDEKRIDYDEN